MEVSIPFVRCPICPKTDIRTYISSINNIIAHYDKIWDTEDDLQDAILQVCRHFDAPETPGFIGSSRSYQKMTHRGFRRAEELLEGFDIDKKQTTKMLQDNTFREYLALLEFFGTLILNPRKIRFFSPTYMADESLVINANSILSQWGSQILDKVEISLDLNTIIVHFISKKQQEITLV